MEYVGLDPDEKAVESVARMGRGARGLQARVEEVCLESESFDWVVAIRSLNHFQDLDKALENMLGALRDGGRVLAVESLALPLVRSRSHQRLCHENADGGFQHFRNWGSEEFIRWVERRFACEVLVHRPVGRDTCDQWFVVLKKVGSR